MRDALGEGMLYFTAGEDCFVGRKKTMASVMGPGVLHMLAIFTLESHASIDR